MSKSLLIYVFILTTTISIAQVDSTQIISDKLFQLIEDASENFEENDFYELVENLIQNPIDVNTATKEDLLRIPFLSPKDADTIIKERKKRKGFKSISELNSIKTIRPDLILLLSQFLTISESYNVQSKVGPHNRILLRSRIIADLQNRKGFILNNFLGNKLKSYNRVKAFIENFSIGGITEKDAGEQSFTDHYSGFVSYSSHEILNKVLLGDFSSQFGQGLLLWSPYSFSKGTETINSPIKRERNIVPHLSSEENKYFRGIASTFKFGQLNTSLFYSTRKIDGTISDGRITGLSYTGYHRTGTELYKKQIINESDLGIILNYKYSQIIDLGILYLENQFDKDFLGNSPSEFKGNSFSSASFSHNLHFSDFSYFGEIALSNKSLAYLGNVYVPLSDNIEFLISYRNYSPNYKSLYANGFGEFNNTQNEIGYYLGSKIKSVIGVFNFYYDIYKAPSKSYYSDFPITGNDFLINYSSKITRTTQLNLKIKTETRDVSNDNNERYERIIEETKSGYRLDIKYKLTKKLEGRSRVEFNRYRISNKVENGFLSLQELRYNYNRIISIASRFILFDTESYNTRIYQFENDLRGVMTNLPMFGEGFRWYILLNYTPLNNFIISIKYSETYKPNEISLGSGDSLIKNNVDNRLSIQLDYSIH